MREAERSITRIRERLARQEELGKTITGLKEAVETLTATYNKGRGAIWVIGGFGVIIGVVGKALLGRWIS